MVMPRTQETAKLTGQSRRLAEGPVAAFRSQFHGELIQPGDEAYESARRVWNGAIDRHPALVARATGVADVRAVVRFARDRGLPLAVRGGGHNVAGTAVCDDGVVLDHGGWLSVTAKLAPTTLHRGDRVARGDLLGHPARRRLYLEIRVAVGPGGIPIDPEPLLH